MGRGSDANPVAQRFAHGRWGGGQRTSGVRFAGSFGSFVLAGSAARLRMEMGEKSLLERGKTKQREQSDTNSKKGKKMEHTARDFPDLPFPPFRASAKHAVTRANDAQKENEIKRIGKGRRSI